MASMTATVEITATSATTDRVDAGQVSSPSHLTSIEALRGIAAVYVVCFHTAMIPVPALAVPEWIAPFLLSGNTGVVLFFVISAFTLSLSWYTRRDGLHPARNFYLRRIFRIVPLFYALLVLTVSCNWILLGAKPSLSVLGLNIAMLFNFVPGKSTGIVSASWTIGVEMLFYLAFPVIASIARTPLRMLLCFGGAILTAYVLYAGVQHLPMSAAAQDLFFRTSIFLHLPVFLLGMMTYFIFSKWMARRKWPTWVGMVMVMLALSIHVLSAYQHIYEHKINADSSAPMWMLLVLGLYIYPAKFIVNAVTKFYGRISYSVYLNHPIFVATLTPIYRVIYRHIPMRGEALTLCILLTFSLLTPWAYLTYRFIEQPGIRFGSRLLKRM